MEITMEESLMERVLAALERVERVDVAAAAAMEERLREAEATIASLRAAAGGRKTALAAKYEGLDAGGLDAALSSLSIEQRIAVKSGMLRGGLV